MSESKIILTCLECENPDIVKTINSWEHDSYHCVNCGQEYFESVNYGDNSDVFRAKLLEKTVEEQATLLQQRQTEINKLIEHISYAVYYMKQSGYPNYESGDPEFQMYNELKTILDVAKFSHKKVKNGHPKRANR